MELRQMDPETTSARDIIAASAALTPLFTQVAFTIHHSSGEDLSSGNPTPELFAAVHGWFDAISRSLKTEGRMPPCFESVNPAFVPGKIRVDFRLAPAFQPLLPAINKSIQS